MRISMVFIVLVAVGVWVALPHAQAQTLSAGAVFRDCPDCPEMVVVPPGIFVMGSPAGERSTTGDEGPQHLVTISEFFAVGRYEVTVGEFRQFITETGYRANGCVSWRGDRWTVDFSMSWQTPGYTQSDQHPAVCISWNDAQAYVRWLSGKTGQTYRLPTEAEWEYAARAGTTDRYPWGDSPVGEFANSGTEICCAGRIEGRDRWEYTSPVGSFPANAFGLYDMLGNAWEWTQDCWRSGYAGAPIDGSAWVQRYCSVRVYRGGSWDHGPQDARPASRGRLYPRQRYISDGFRVARRLDQPETEVASGGVVAWDQRPDT